jgi:hypothetical protein
MRGDPFFEWLTTTPWAKAMNGPEWAFPVVESLHFVWLALSVGTIAIVDLRLPLTVGETLWKKMESKRSREVTNIASAPSAAANNCSRLKGTEFGLRLGS